MKSNTSHYKEFLNEAMHLALAMASHSYTPASVREFFRAKKTRSNIYSKFIGNVLKPKNKKGFLIRLSCEIKETLNILQKAEVSNNKSINERIKALEELLDPDLFLITTHDEGQFFTEEGQVEHAQQAIFSTYFEGSLTDEMNINVVFNRQKEFDLFFLLLAKQDLSIIESDIFFKASHTFDLNLCKAEILSRTIVKDFPTKNIDVYKGLLDGLSEITA